MHATGVLKARLRENVEHIDPRCRKCLWQAVDALLHGNILSLTHLGRSLPRAIDAKHRIKTMDRFLGSGIAQAAVGDFFRASSKLLIPKVDTLRVLVDWTEIDGKNFALVAGVPIGGRAVPVLVQIYKNAKKPRRWMHRRFLRALASHIPVSCVPILVTDAGFQSTWFNDVAEMGWYFVGRLRNRTLVKKEGAAWVSNKTLHLLASKNPKDLGIWSFPQSSPRERRLVLARRTPRNRHEYGSRGEVLRGGPGVRIRHCQKEPWLLATNIDDGTAEQVVALYALRMQIEETFRDTKSFRFGWSLNAVRSSSPDRLSVLFLIACLAMTALLLVALAAERRGDTRKLIANTSKRRSLSLFSVGRYLLHDFTLKEPARIEIGFSIHELRRLIAMTVS